MHDPDFVLLYVEDPSASARFYGTLLDKAPVEESPTFAMFALGSGLKLGLWSRHTVEPRSLARGGGSELALTVGDDGAVDALHEAWADRGLAIAQPPTRMDFGYTFVALDPDGHRVRVFAPSRMQ